MTLQETLKAYSTKSKTDSDVMRAIMNHAQWQAPVLYARDILKTEFFDRIAIWGNEPITPTKGQLFLFTDDTAGHNFVNKNYNAGPYATALQGWTLFENLPDAFTGVQVNPASPVSEGWQIPPGAFALTRIWAKAIHLEHLLQASGPGLVEALLAFPAFTIFTVPSGGIATAVNAGGMKNPGMLFTTPDCADIVQHEAGPTAQIKRVIVAGSDLFKAFDRLGVDGFIVNPRGPGVAQILPLDFCKGVIEVMQLESKAQAYEAEAKQVEGA